MITRVTKRYVLPPVQRSCCGAGEPVCGLKNTTSAVRLDVVSWLIKLLLLRKTSVERNCIIHVLVVTAVMVRATAQLLRKDVYDPTCNSPCSLSHTWARPWPEPASLITCLDCAAVSLMNENIKIHLEWHFFILIGLCEQHKKPANIKQLKSHHCPSPGPNTPSVSSTEAPLGAKSDPNESVCAQRSWCEAKACAVN